MLFSNDLDHSIVVIRGEKPEQHSITRNRCRRTVRSNKAALVRVQHAPDKVGLHSPLGGRAAVVIVAGIGGAVHDLADAENIEPARGTDRAVARRRARMVDTGLHVTTQAGCRVDEAAFGNRGADDRRIAVIVVELGLRTLNSPLTKSVLADSICTTWF